MALAENEMYASRSAVNLGSEWRGLCRQRFGKVQS
jgi:hypothetical protein